jgi:hypothetical protein
VVLHIKKSHIGPIFSNDIINSGCYCEAILYPFIGHLNKGKITRGYSQPDGASAHIGSVSMTLLHVLSDNNFRGHLTTMVTQSYILIINCEVQ